MDTWNYPFEKYAIALCRAGMHVSMGSCLWEFRRQEFIAARFVQPAPPNSRIAIFMGLPQLRRMQAFVPVSVAGRKQLLIWPHGEALRIQFLAPWRSLPKVLSMVLRI